MNIRAVLNLIRRRDAFSVAEIADEVAFSKTTIKKMVDTLMSMNLVLSAGKGTSTEEGGKKPELYRFNASYGYAVAVHVTPDSILAAATNMSSEITRLVEVDSTENRGLDSVIGKLADTISSLVASHRATGETLVGIAIALPGLADTTTGVSIFSPHYPSWGRHVPFGQLLRQRLREIPDVPLIIDCVNRFQAIAEMEKGVAGGVSNFIIIDALNEGLGAGIVTHGELMRGAQSLSGEIGHMTVDPAGGAKCICGNSGCFEAMVSARNLRTRAIAAFQAGAESRLFLDYDLSTFKVSDVCRLAQDGDAFCLSLLDDAARWFVVGIGNIVMVNDPELVVIQGEYVTAGPLFLDRLKNGLKRIGLPDVEKHVRVEYSSLGKERGLVGGAAHVISGFFSRRLAFGIRSAVSEP